NLALKAVWEREKYNITYYANDGTTEKDVKQKEYDIDYIIGACNFTKPGYKCDKWNTSPDGTGTSYPMGKTYKTNAPLTLYAVWEPETYHAYFITGVNGKTEERAILYNTPFGKLPTPPERPGYTFEGWYRNNGQKVYSTDIYNTAGDITLRANWVANTYKITLDYGMADMTNTSLDITFDKNYEGIPTPEKSGYIFAGWFTEKGGDIEIKNGMPMTTPNDHTLYAAWVKNPVLINLDAQGGSLDSYYIYCSDTYGTLPAPTKEGYKFDGWYNGTSKVNATTSVGESTHTLTAHWSKATYKLSLNADGGACNTASINYQYGDIINLPDPSKTDYVFIGWYDENGNEIASGKALNRSGNITATAKYAQAKEGYITFVASGNIVAQIKADNLPADEPAVPLIEGFSGKWESYNKNSQIVKAIYTPTTFTVTYNINGESNTITAPYGTAISEPDVKAPDGYLFTGWDKTFPTTMPAENVTVSAVFTKTESIATFISDGAFVGAIPYSDGDVKVTEPEAPQKPGYDYFWPEYSLQNGGTVIFASRKYAEYKARFMADGELVDELTYTIVTESLSPKAPTEKKGYDARWEEYKFTPGGITVNAVYTPKTITLTFKASNKTIAEVKYKYGATSITPPDVPKDDWYTIRWGEYTLGPEDSTCEAIYTPKSFTATFMADGKVVDKIPFNKNTTELIAPDVPYKIGFDGYWSKYNLNAQDITINAVYSCYSKISIFGYLPTRVESYRTTMVFRPYVTNAPDEYEIHWLVNGKDMGKGNSSGAYTVTEARETYDIKAVLLINNQIVAQSETETVKIKSTFIDKIRAFFRGLFGRLPVKTQ
ncbi:MAG: InlB B-repeat-containing protein, partial [Clostridia bacterium]|nr:InlB B-repeat-containing protein [Clostridia bacterium]